MKNISSITAAVLFILSTSACDDEYPYDLDGLNDNGVSNFGAPKDVPGCARLKAFMPNPYDDSSWWAIDFSDCGTAPEPRIFSWESGNGDICEIEYQPLGFACEVVEIFDCDIAVDTWHMTAWAMGDLSFSIGFEDVEEDQDFDYEAGSALICKEITKDGIASWDCTGLPKQIQSCDPLTVG